MEKCNPLWKPITPESFVLKASSSLSGKQITTRFQCNWGQGKGPGDHFKSISVTAQAIGPGNLYRIIYAATYFSFFGLVLMSPRTMISEKSIRNLLSKVAILWEEEERQTWKGCSQAFSIPAYMGRWLGRKVYQLLHEFPELAPTLH